jgi:hypothetical protein
MGSMMATRDGILSPFVATTGRDGPDRHFIESVSARAPCRWRPPSTNDSPADAEHGVEAVLAAEHLPEVGAGSLDDLFFGHGPRTSVGQEAP